MTRPKKDPVFGVEALKELDQKLEELVKPDPPLSRKIRIRDTRFFKGRMRYLYTGEDE